MERLCAPPTKPCIKDWKKAWWWWELWGCRAAPRLPQQGRVDRYGEKCSFRPFWAATGVEGDSDGLPGTGCGCSVPQQHHRWLLVPDVCQSITMSIIVSTFQRSSWTAPPLSSTDSPVSWMSSFEAELKCISRILAKVLSSLGETAGSGVWRPLWITWSGIQAQLNYTPPKIPTLKHGFHILNNIRDFQPPLLSNCFRSCSTMTSLMLPYVSPAVMVPTVHIELNFA